MKTLLCTALAGLMISLAGPASAADEKIDKNKIVGVWVPKDAKSPPGTTVEFTKDGKVKMHIPLEKKDFNIDGTYKIDGNKFTITLKGPGGKEKTETETIKTLNDTTFTTVDEGGKVTEFTRKKKGSK